MDAKTNDIQWQEWCNLTLGLLLFVSPWILPSSGNEITVRWNAHLVGTAIAFAAAVALYARTAWSEYLNIVLGTWLVCSPWLFGVSGIDASGMLLIGSTVAAISAWSMMHVKNYRKWRDAHHMAR